MEPKEIRVRYVPDTEYLESLKEAATKAAAAIQGFVDAAERLPSHLKAEKAPIADVIAGDRESFSGLAHQISQEINREASQNA